MNIKRYKINEEMAKTAKHMVSFSDYIPNSATNGYEGYINKFESAVNELLEKHGKTATTEQIELIEYYADRYSQKLAEAIDRKNRIGSMCPSVMVAGASNFPVRKKEKQNAAEERFWQECGDLFSPTANYYYRRIETMLTNKTIYSNDALAIEKLENKLKDLEETHAKMKAHNTYYRKHKTMKGFEELTDQEAEKLDKEILRSIYGQPFEPWELSNSNANIKRVKERIKELKKLKEQAQTPSESKYPAVDGIEVVENAEAMRIQLIFDGIPDAETRELLKSNGFRWSPSFGAWQRQLTSNGIYATKETLNKIKEMQK